MLRVRDEFETPRSPMVISGNIGPRGDGYQPGALMSAKEAEAYHAEQIGVFRDTAADLVSGFTLNYANEAIGIARAAKAAGMPVGHLAHGRDRRPPADRTDAQGRDPSDRRRNRRGAGLLHDQLRASDALRRARSLAGEPWVKRLRGIRANASKRSHAELETMTGSRRRRSGRAWPAVRRPATQAPPHQCARRLLRHRLSPRGADLLRLRTGGVSRCRHSRETSSPDERP